tara:strand:+ start:102 stop:524 length:423 start_codon:yes stop_codon:yes gene_type:complete
MLRVVPFNPGLISSIETDFEFPESMRAAFDNGQQVVGYAVLGKDDVVAVGGIHEMWPGVGEGWVILSKHAPKWKLSLARYAKTLFGSILATTNLHRVQASIHMKDPDAIRFARWMGFEHEGVMYKFGPDGSDYYRMAKVI